jgi:hypothetical protein
MTRSNSHRPVPFVNADTGGISRPQTQQRPTLTAQWMVVEGQLVCQWRAE